MAAVFNGTSHISQPVRTWITPIWQGIQTFYVKLVPHIQLKQIESQSAWEQRIVPDIKATERRTLPRAWCGFKSATVFQHMKKYRYLVLPITGAAVLWLQCCFFYIYLFMMWWEEHYVCDIIHPSFLKVLLWYAYIQATETVQINHCRNWSCLQFSKGHSK